MKILLSPSKEMNTENLLERENDILFKHTYDIIDYIKSVNQDDCFVAFKTKEDIYDQNQQINTLSKPALLLFDGIAFRQINKDNLDDYKDLCILNSLYGLSKASDYISPFRFDYTMPNSKKHIKAMYEDINDYLKEEDIVYNLASNEFGSRINHDNLINFDFIFYKDNQEKRISVDAKKMRGSLAMTIAQGNTNFEDFNQHGYSYNKELSSKDLIVFTK